MNWEAAGAIGEIVGAIAVIATLAYLATQIRYARLAERRVTLSQEQKIIDKHHIHNRSQE